DIEHTLSDKEQLLWYHSKLSVAVLVLSISLAPWFNLAPQAFAQTNESVKVLITDAIEDL
ncbi:MAG TPA: hypothetical protein VKA87_08475, partial [Nitrososphaeraceae archaeon]|nr:hypothetical protein [Nitrososphaeraceae archaeon]